MLSARPKPHPSRPFVTSSRILASGPSCIGSPGRLKAAEPGDGTPRRPRASTSTPRLTDAWSTPGDSGARDRPVTAQGSLLGRQARHTGEERRELRFGLEPALFASKVGVDSVPPALDLASGLDTDRPLESGNGEESIVLGRRSPGQGIDPSDRH